MGKGDKPRPVNRAKWDKAPYWVELEKRRKAARKKDVKK